MTNFFSSSTERFGQPPDPVVPVVRPFHQTSVSPVVSQPAANTAFAGLGPFSARAVDGKGDTTHDRSLVDGIGTPGVSDSLPFSAQFFPRRATAEGGTPDSYSSTLTISTRSGRSIYPATISEAVGRCLVLQRAFSTGALCDEVERIGVRPEWLRLCHSQTTKVAISEQLIPLPTLFAKLDRFGSPAALVRALGLIGATAQMLKRESGRSVWTGQITSLDHVVTKRSITSGFYLLLPHEGDSLERKRLFSNSELDKLDGCGYRDLSIDQARLSDLAKTLANQADAAGRRSEKSQKDFSRQQDFNRRREEQGLEVGSDMLRRMSHFELNAKRDLQTSVSAAHLLADLRGAVDDARRTSGGRTDYVDFVQKFNARFAERVFPGMPFATDHGEALNLLPTLGVSDWYQFLRALIAPGVLDPREPILRLRVDQEGVRPHYKVLKIASLTRNGVTVCDRAEPDRHYSIDEIVDSSRARVAAGEPPSLIPIAAMRYWAAYGMGNSIIMDDGMPYEKLNRLEAALADPRLVLVPRKPSIMPYTKLASYVPADPEDPYRNLRELFSAGDYYSYAARTSQSSSDA